jgi:hypothetical protein
MNKIPLVQDLIFEFSCDPNWCQEYLNKTLNNHKINFNLTLENYSSMPNTDYGYPIPKDERLFLWLQECVNKVSEYRFGVSNQTICDAWITKTTFSERSKIHYHSYSVLSGLLYLNDSTTETIFYPTDYFFDKFSTTGMFKCKDNTEPLKYVPNTGTLIIFPSYLVHKISVHKSKNTRYTLAFNTFFEGNVSETDTLKLSLSINKNYFE